MLLCCRLLLHFHQYSTRDIQTSEFRSMKYQILNKYTWFRLRGLLTIFTARRYAQARSLLSAGVWQSVCPSRSCIVSRWLKISSNFFHGPVAHHSSLLIQAQYQIPSGTLQRGAITGVGNNCDFRLKLPFILETVRDRNVVAMEC